jgi:hypothetical protein
MAVGQGITEDGKCINCVEMNSHKRKTCRMKTYFKGKRGLDKKKTPIGFEVEKKDIINKNLECKMRKNNICL